MAYLKSTRELLTNCINSGIGGITIGICLERINETKWQAVAEWYFISRYITYLPSYVWSDAGRQGAHVSSPSVDLAMT